MRRDRAFSLVELLVVVTILALLAALLFPVFAQARRRSLFASATIGLRQIGVATSQYIVDNDGHVPIRNWGYLEYWQYKEDERSGRRSDATDDPLAAYGAVGWNPGMRGIKQSDNPMMCPGVNRSYEYRWTFSIREDLDEVTPPQEVRRVEPQPGSVLVRCNNLLTKGYITGFFGSSTTYSANPAEREGRELLLRGDGSVTNVDTRSERLLLRRPLDGVDTWTEAHWDDPQSGQAFSAWPGEPWPPDWTTILRPATEGKS